MLLVNKPYLEMFQNQDRYCLLVGGAGSGKSFAAAQKIVTILTSHEYAKVLLVRQTHRSIRESQFALIRSIIAEAGLSSHFEYTESRLEIRFKKSNDRKEDNYLISQGLDDVEKLKSITDVTHIWIEEATEIRELDFEQINLRLRYQNARYLQIILTFNPVGEEHWIKRRFFSQPVENSYILKTTYVENWENLPEVYREQIENLKNTNAGMYQIYALGNWANVTENGTFDTNYFRTFVPDESDDKVVKVLYVDPNLSEKGKGDTTAIVVVGYNPLRGQISIYDVFCESIADSNQLFDTIARLSNRHGVRAVDMDGNVTQENTYKNLLREWMNRRGLSMKVNFRRYRVNDLVKITQLHWVSCDIAFAEGLDKSQRQFFAQLYAFEGKKTERKKDDAPDALICGIQSLYEYKLLKFINKLPQGKN